MQRMQVCKVVLIVFIEWDLSWSDMNLFQFSSWRKYLKQAPRVWQSHSQQLILLVVNRRKQNNGLTNTLERYRFLVNSFRTFSKKIIPLPESHASGTVLKASGHMDAKLDIEYMECEGRNHMKAFCHFTWDFSIHKKLSLNMSFLFIRFSTDPNDCHSGNIHI